MRREREGERGCVYHAFTSDGPSPFISLSLSATTGSSPPTWFYPPGLPFDGLDLFFLEHPPFFFAKKNPKKAHFPPFPPSFRILKIK